MLHIKYVVNCTNVIGTNPNFSKVNSFYCEEVLEEITGPVTLSNGFSKAVCGSCRKLLLKYKRSANDVERIVCFVRARTNSRVRMKRYASAISIPRSTKRLSVQESTESPERRGLFRDPAPAIDDQSPDIGIQPLQAPFFGASSAVSDNKESDHRIVKVSALPSNRIGIYS
jgi:LSD1 subclass zinc finger protein